MPLPPFIVPEVRPGDSIPRALEDLAREERAHRFASNDLAARIHKTPSGVSILSKNPPPSFLHPWKTSITGTSATIRAGSVDDLIPTIEGVSLTGLDQSGKDVGRPTLRITGGPGENSRSFICLECVIDTDLGAIDREAPEPAIVTHRQAIEETETLAICILAQISWSGSSIVRVFQSRHFNLSYELVKATDTRAARHRFT